MGNRIRIGIVVALLGFVPVGANAEVCNPDVRLDGDPELVRALRDLLDARSTADPTCPPLEVHVHTVDDGAIELELDEVCRRVTSLEAAAAVIESSSQRHPDWFGQTAWMLPSAPALPILSTDAPALTLDSPMKLRGSVSMQTAGAAAGDAWMGVTIDTCVKWGWACIGGMGSTMWTTRGQGRDHTLLATAGPELTEGDWFFRPEAAVGWGWNHQTVPLDLDNTGNTENTYSLTRSELRVGVQVTGGRKLNDHLAWEASAGAYVPAWRLRADAIPDPDDGDPTTTPSPDGTDPNNNGNGDPIPTPNASTGIPGTVDFPTSIMMHVSFGIRFGGS